MRLSRQLLSVLAVLSAGCDAPIGLPGVWTGSVPGGTSFVLTLTETEHGVVSGAGRINNSVIVFPANVTGAHAHPSVTLAITATGVQAMNFSGALDATMTRLNGVLYGSGFAGDSLRLSRSTPAVSGRITAP